MLYPVLSLTSTQSGLYLTSGPHIHIFDPAVHAPLASTANAESLVPLEVGTSIHSGLVRLLAVSQTGQWLASVADDKLLKVWEVSDGGRKIRLASTRLALKKISTLTFTSNDSIVLGDRLGDAFTYPLHPDPNAPAPPQGKDSKTTFDVNADPASNPDGKLILGHTSPITALFLTENEDYICTADRDEHIRLSRYPQGEVVERFLLGHRHFVSALLPLPATKQLLSAGGEPSIHVWSFPEGILKVRIPIIDQVLAHTTVRAPTRWGRRDPVTGEKRERLPNSRGVSVMKLLECEGRAIFYSLGATALFSVSLEALSNESNVEVLDLGRPVLDFCVLSSPSSSSSSASSPPTTSEPRLLVSVDEGLEGTAPGLRLVSGRSFTALPSVDTLLASLLASSLLLAPAPALPQSKNNKGPAADFNLYQQLIELPKWPGSEAEAAEDAAEEDQRQKRAEELVTKKESGRRKNNGGVSLKGAGWAAKTKKPKVEEKEEQQLLQKVQQTAKEPEEPAVAAEDDEEAAMNL